MNRPTVLFVGRDPLMQQVVRYLLPHSASSLLAAAGAEDAAAQVAGQPPRFAVIDVPDGADPTPLLLGLRAHLGPVPLLIATADPAALPPFPPEWQPQPRVLRSPPDLEAMRKMMLEAWQETDPGRPAKSSRLVQVVSFAVGVVVVTLGLLLVLPILGVPYVPDVLKMLVGRPEAASAPPATTVHLIKGKKDAFELEQDAAVAMRIPKPFRIGDRPAQRQLTLAGSLAFDPDLLGRVQARFPGEVIAIGTTDEPTSDPRGQTAKDQTLRYGNHVQKGQLMAIVWSKDLGEKKSELVDWMVKLALDKENLDRLEELWRSGAGTEANYRAARNAVSADLNGVSRARLTLQVWKVPETEIKGIEKEAERIISSKSVSDLSRMKSNLEKWARVEVRAPFDGIIVEKNLQIGNMVDPTQDLFRVADMRRLAVFANAYEEDQRLLQDMQAHEQPRPVPWRVHLTSDPERRPLPSDGIERIGYIVDPQQRTNLVIGKVDNKDGRLRVGQSATALVDVPAPPGVVAIPAAALVEDGTDSVVFVQPDPGKLVYVMKRVSVVQRFNGDLAASAVPNKAGRESDPKQWAYVRSVLDPAQKSAGLQELSPGEWVVASAVVELKAALEEVQAREKAQR